MIVKAKKGQKRNSEEKTMVLEQWKTCVEMANGTLAVQDLLNGNVDYVVIDSAPASKIVESFNAQ